MWLLSLYYHFRSKYTFFHERSAMGTDRFLLVLYCEHKNHIFRPRFDEAELFLARYVVPWLMNRACYYDVMVTDKPNSKKLEFFASWKIKWIELEATTEPGRQQLSTLLNELLLTARGQEGVDAWLKDTQCRASSTEEREEPDGTDPERGTGADQADDE